MYGVIVWLVIQTITVYNIAHPLLLYTLSLRVKKILILRVKHDN